MALAIVKGRPALGRTLDPLQPPRRPAGTSFSCTARSTAAAHAPSAGAGTGAGQHHAQARTSCWAAPPAPGHAPTPDHRQIHDRRRRALRGAGHGHRQQLARLLRPLGARPAPPPAAAPGRRRPPRTRHQRTAVPALASTTPRHAPAASRPPTAPGPREHLITAGSPIAAGARSATSAATGRRLGPSRSFNCTSCRSGKRKRPALSCSGA